MAGRYNKNQEPATLSQPVLELFVPRPPLRPFLSDDPKPPIPKQPKLSGLGDFLDRVHQAVKEALPYQRTLSVEEKREEKRKNKIAKAAAALQDALQHWNPEDDENIKTDLQKTIFVYKLAHETTDKAIKREFEIYGPIRRVRLVVDKNTGKSRGYAFVEFERERDMRAAYKEADGMRLDGKRISVDVERGRTKGWKPRRLGGGLGGRDSQKPGAERPASDDRDRRNGGSSYPPPKGPPRDYRGRESSPPRGERDRRQRSRSRSRDRRDRRR